LNTAALATRLVARAIAAVQVTLGILFWTGHAISLEPVHIAVGLLLILDLWVAVGLGLKAGAPVGLGVLAFAWSLGMPVLGLLQGGLLPGAAHMVVQVLHLLVGLAAVGLVEALARSQAVATRAAA
jgi:hypothetical protein